MVEEQLSVVASPEVEVKAARCFWLASLVLDEKPSEAEVAVLNLAHLASLAGEVVGEHS